MTQLEDRTIALAAILQVSEQVQNLARRGAGAEAQIQPLMQSILVLDALNTASVYGGVEGVKRGLELVAEGTLNSPAGDHIELLRYAMSLLTLTEQIQKRPDQYQSFGQDIDGLSAYQDEEFLTACSDLYKKYISGLQPQIIVQGEEDFLQRDDIPVRIRSLLLAGIRAAVLWRQKGGGRFKLLWERGKMRTAAAALLGQQ